MTLLGASHLQAFAIAQPSNGSRPAANQTGLTLPNAAIKQTPQGAGVWKLHDGKPALAAIKLGSSSLDGLVQVLDGISAGDEVVVHTERELSEGARVKIVEQLAGQRK